MTRSIVFGLAVIFCTIQIDCARAGPLRALGHAIWDATKDAAKEHPSVKEGEHEFVKKGAEGAVEGAIKGASPPDDGDDDHE